MLMFYKSILETDCGNSVNFYIQNLLGILLCSAILLSGCSKHNLQMAKEFEQIPEPTETNMSKALQCVNGILKDAPAKIPYVFLVRDVVDGTIREDASFVNGPLSDAGRMQLINILSDNTYPHLGLVIDHFPMMFKALNNETVGINRYGLPTSQNMNTFLNFFAQIINNARNRKKLPPSSKLMPLVISGSFTRLDNDSLFQSGWGQNAGVNSDEDERRSGQIDIGKTKSARAISLVVNLIEPRYNVVVSSRSFDLFFYRTNKRGRFRVALGDGFYGFSKNEVIVEGLHGAQKTLLDAVAIWILDKTYGEQANVASCLTPEQAVLTK
jgi:hypothetical protein